MSSQQQIGKNIKKARKELDLKQSEVAEKAGITSNYFAMIERGEIENPGSKVLTKIAKVLKLKSSDIFPF